MLTKLFINPNLMCSGRNSILYLPSISWFLKNFPLELSFSHGPILNFVIFIFDSGVPFTKNRTKLCVDRLHSYDLSYDFKVSTYFPSMVWATYCFQRQIHILVRFLHVDRVDNRCWRMNISFTYHHSLWDDPIFPTLLWLLLFYTALSSFWFISFLWHTHLNFHFFLSYFFLRW